MGTVSFRSHGPGQVTTRAHTHTCREHVVHSVLRGGAEADGVDAPLGPAEGVVRTPR